MSQRIINGILSWVSLLLILAGFLMMKQGRNLLAIILIAVGIVLTVLYFLRDLPRFIKEMKAQKEARKDKTE